MKILMLSIDKGLLGQGQLGDVCERHKKYSEFCDKLDIIVFNKLSFPRKRESSVSVKLSEKVTSYPTNSKSKLFYYFDVLKLGKKLFQKNYYDLIVCQDPFLTGLIGLKLKNKFGSKLLIHFHGDFKFPFWNVVKNADGVRVMSQGQKEKLVKKGMPADKIYVIPTPVDLEKFDTQCHPERSNVVSSLPTGDTMYFRSSQPPLQRGRETGANKNVCHPDASQDPEKKENKNFWIPASAGMTDNKIILFVGRLEKVKKLHWFLKIFKTLITNHQSPITLKIIGKGSQENKLKYLVKKLDLADKVKFVGQLLQNEIINYYYNSDIIVLPSISESFGKVLVEANACGKPVVATATTGAKEIIQDGINGFLVPIGDAEKMSDKILDLLNNPKIAAQMGENGRKLVMEKFDGNRQLQKIKEMWQEIVNL